MLHLIRVCATLVSPISLPNALLQSNWADGQSSRTLLVQDRSKQWAGGANRRGFARAAERG